MPPVRRVLFVDDNTMVLSAVQRLLRSVRSELQIHLATSGANALEVLSRDRFDVIVSDMRMPEMDGATLLDEVRRSHPGVVRIALSGETDREAILSVVGSAHQYLSKPCDGDELKTALRQVFMLQDLLDHDELRTLVAWLRSLPTLPALYDELAHEIHSGNPSIRRIAEIAEKDIALTAKFLQLVNSAFFGLRVRAGTAEQAVQMLGLELVRALNDSARLVSELDAAATGRFLLPGMWQRSVSMNRVVRRLAALEEVPGDVAAHAMTAAMLHDVGRLVLSAVLPDDYGKVVDHAIARRLPLIEAEQEILRCTHAQVGAYLLGLWGLPDPVVTAVAWHHRPSAAGVSGLTPLALVHAADAIVSESRPESDPFVAPVFEWDFLASLTTRHDYAAWKTDSGQTLDARSVSIPDDSRFAISQGY